MSAQYGSCRVDVGVCVCVCVVDNSEYVRISPSAGT
jgi:hypothetical protein